MPALLDWVQRRRLLILSGLVNIWLLLLVLPLPGIFGTPTSAETGALPARCSAHGSQSGVADGLPQRERPDLATGPLFAGADHHGATNETTEPPPPSLNLDDLIKAYWTPPMAGGAAALLGDALGIDWAWADVLDSIPLFTSTTYNDDFVSKQLTALQRQAIDALASKVAIVYVALGDVPCRTSQIEAAFWKLFGPVQWRGRVTVVTDQPLCVNTTQVENLLNKPSLPVDWYTLNTTSSSENIVKIKQWKMRVFEATSTADYVLYLDVDAFVQHSLEPFLTYSIRELHASLRDRLLGRRTTANRMSRKSAPSGSAASRAGQKTRQVQNPSTFGAFCAPGWIKKSDYKTLGLGEQMNRCHSGILVLHRYGSARCLAEWRRLYPTGPRKRDQQALAVVIANSPVCEPAMILPAGWMIFPNTTDAPALLADAAGPHTVLHVTRTFRMLQLLQNNVSLEEALQIPPVLTKLKPLMYFPPPSHTRRPPGAASTASSRPTSPSSAQPIRQHTG